MKSLKLNRRLILEERVRVADGEGGFTESWVSKGAIWANLEARGGAEQQLGARTLSVSKFRVITRTAPFGADSRPRTDQHFRDGGRTFDILAVGEYGEVGRYLEIWAEEGRP